MLVLVQYFQFLVLRRFSLPRLQKILFFSKLVVLHLRRSSQTTDILDLEQNIYTEVHQPDKLMFILVLDLVLLHYLESLSIQMLSLFLHQMDLEQYLFLELPMKVSQELFLLLVEHYLHSLVDLNHSQEQRMLVLVQFTSLMLPHLQPTIHINLQEST